MEAEVHNSDDDGRFIYLDDDNNSFINDASDISESVCEQYAFQNVEVNIDDVLKNARNKSISHLDDTIEFTDF